MPFTHRKSLILAVLLAATLAAGPAEASKQVTPRLSGLHARIGQGGKVDLAASTLTPAQLAALRPDYEKLKPRKGRKMGHLTLTAADAASAEATARAAAAILGIEGW